MMDTATRSASKPMECTVYVEACHGGVNPETMVRVVWQGNALSEERQIFDTLEEALAYAQSLCPTEPPREQ